MREEIGTRHGWHVLGTRSMPSEMNKARPSACEQAVFFTRALSRGSLRSPLEKESFPVQLYYATFQVYFPVTGNFSSPVTEISVTA